MKKGFTLIELISVIILLGIVGLIAIPVINNTLRSQKQTLYESQITDIKLATERWAFDHVEELPVGESDFITVTISDLKSTGYLEKELIDPRSGDPIPNELEVKITRKGEGYYYSIEE